MFIYWIFNSDTNELIDAVIPCEFCGGQVSIDDWDWHMVNK